MRKRIIKAEKVYSASPESPINVLPIQGRTKRFISKKLERVREVEISNMFKHLTIDSILDEKRYLKTLTQLPTKQTIIPVQEEVVVPQDYEIIPDIVLGNIRVGKNYLKTFIERLEVVSVIDWKDSETA
jgi:tRNA G37 N-methylase Trm5